MGTNPEDTGATKRKEVALSDALRLGVAHSRLALPFRLAETANSIYQQIDFMLRQLLAKSRHTSLAVGYH